jgi:hypothetical protein
MGVCAQVKLKSGFCQVFFSILAGKTFGLTTHYRYYSFFTCLWH